MVSLEAIAKAVADETGVNIQVYGFDTGSGMPESADQRDLPYVWEKGHFEMDIPKLKSRLTTAKLIIGNLSKTVPEFIITEKPLPIGFVSIDVDYYTSTVEAFKLFTGPHEYFIPRTFCYFDDCIGGDEELHCKFSGELLAIEEFNQANEHINLGEIHCLRNKRNISSSWNDSMYVLHRFMHHDYCKNILSTKDWQLPLR